MADAVKTVRIDVVAGSTRGAQQVNDILSRLKGKSGSLGAANDNLKGTFDKLGGSISKASGHGSKIGAVLDNISGRAAGAAPQVANLAATFAKFGPQAAVLAAIALSIGAIASKAIDAASKQEVWLANLETVTGGATKAKESYAALVQFAAKTPFDLGQSVEGFTKLRTLGLEATEGALTSFGNTAAAMGKPLSQMIEAVADASTFEFERLKEFGIKSKQQADTVTFTFNGVNKTVRKNSAEIQKYLEDIGNTKFAGAMARQMDTIKGAMSNVEDSVFQMFAAIGSGKLGQSFKEILKTIGAGVAAITPLLASIGNVLGAIVGSVGKVVNVLASMWSNVATGGAGAGSALERLTITFNVLAQGVEVFGDIVAAVFGAVSQVIGGVVNWARDGLGGMLSDVTAGFDNGGRSWSNSIMGVLRAVKVVVGLMPQLFSVAIKDTIAMFRSLGSVVGRLLSGDFSALKDVGATLSASFANTGRALHATGRIAKAVYSDVKGADAAIERLKGKSDVKAKLDSGKVTTPKADAKRDKEAEKRTKQENEFWQTLKGEFEIAKLLPLAAEDYRKQLELQKILGRDLNAGEKERISSLLQQVRTAQFLTSALDAHQKSQRDIQAEEALFRKRMAGATEAQLDVERTMLSFRNDALAQGLDISSDVFKLAEQQKRLDEQALQNLRERNKELDRARDLAAQYSSAFRNNEAARKYTGDLAALDKAYNGGSNELGITKEVYEQIKDGLKRASRETALAFKEDFANRIEQLGDQFGGTFGKAISGIGQVLNSIVQAARGDFAGLGPIGGILNLISRGKDGELNKVGRAATDAASSALDKLLSGANSPLKSLSKGFGSFKSDLGNLFGKNGDFAKGLGSVLGKAGMGTQIGSAVAGIGNMLGLKMSNTGAQIGGALGSVFGPIGSVLGSIGGGLVGSLFGKKKPYETASVTSATDAASISKRGSSGKDAESLAGQVQQGLLQLAEQFGGSVGSFDLAIGTYNDSYRVREQSFSGKLNYKGSSANGLHSFDDAESAIQFAILDAIKDGALKGIREGTKRLLEAGEDLDEALNKALSFEQVFKDLKAIEDPMAAALDGLNAKFDKLRDIFSEAGASAQELAELEKLYSYQREQAVKDANEAILARTAGFKDILDQLNGDAGGVSKLDQLKSKMSEFDAMKAEIASGKAVDQDAFNELASAILSNAGTVYGTNNKAYQDIVSTLRSTAEGAISNTNAAFAPSPDDATSAAITDQTNQITANQSVQTDYLARIAQALESSSFLRNLNAVGSVNGRELLRY